MELPVFLLSTTVFLLKIQVCNLLKVDVNSTYAPEILNGNGEWYFLTAKLSGREKVEARERGNEREHKEEANYGEF